MTEAEFLQIIRQNRIPEPDPRTGSTPRCSAASHSFRFRSRIWSLVLSFGALFGTVWNSVSGQPPEAQIGDYDVFYWDTDTSYEAEDAVIRRADALFADALFADLGSPVPIQVRNQARVHLWFAQKSGLTRPPLTSVRDGIRQFLVECTCVGVDSCGELYAPFGLADLRAGRLRPNLANHTPSLYGATVATGPQSRATVTGYRQRWPWLEDLSGSR